MPSPDQINEIFAELNASRGDPERLKALFEQPAEAVKEAEKAVEKQPRLEAPSLSEQLAQIKAFEDKLRARAA